MEGEAAVQVPALGRPKEHQRPIYVFGVATPDRHCPISSPPPHSFPHLVDDTLAALDGVNALLHTLSHALDVAVHPVGEEGIAGVKEAGPHPIL